jgi:hypothetical protein
MPLQRCCIALLIRSRRARNPPRARPSWSIERHVVLSKCNAVTCRFRAVEHWLLNVRGIVVTRRRGAAIGQKGETMRAVGLFTHGGPEVLQVIELPEVHAGPGQVRIRVHAATVNPTDIMARIGARAEQQKADPPPYVPGMEAAGIVDEVGSGVPDRLKLGDAVMAIVVPKGRRVSRANCA